MRMTKQLRRRLEGIRRVLDFQELPGMNTREALLQLNNRLVAGATIEREDITTIGNGSAVIMWLESQARVSRQLLDEILE